MFILGLLMVELESNMRFIAASSLYCFQIFFLILYVSYFGMGFVHIITSGALLLFHI